LPVQCSPQKIIHPQTISSSQGELISNECQPLQVQISSGGSNAFENLQDPFREAEEKEAFERTLPHYDTRENDCPPSPKYLDQIYSQIAR
jgi:hypothetical protein